MSNKQNKLIKELISKLELDGVDVSKYTQELENINKNLKGKKYGLVWEQHTEPLIEELKSKVVELQEVKERRIYKGEEYTNNFLIEGDNLESLNAMLNSGLEGKVDIIAIDPPYNIAGEFIYNDNRVDVEDKYRHSKWISFMDERLKLAKKLLSTTGVIFINIDEVEVSNLKLLCDDILGEDNFLSMMSWYKGYGKNDSRFFSNSTEYILVYAKNKFELSNKDMRFRTIKEGFKDVDSIVKNFKGTDHKELEKLIREFYKKNNHLKGIKAYNMIEEGTLRVYSSVTLEKPDNKGYRYNITHPVTKLPVKMPKNGWSRPEYSMNRLIDDGLVLFGDSHNKIPRRKLYLDDMKYGTPKDMINNSEQGGTEIRNLFGEGVFSYPKPVSLIKYLISLYPDKDVLVCDFFAGSATTGHAVLELNKEDGGNRRFILCTNNENNICEDITYQRLNKVINGYTTPKGKEVEGIPANLTYLKTNLINKEDDYIMYDNSHLEYFINLLKLKYGITNEVDLNDSEEVDNKLIKLSTESQDIYVYLNDYIDEEDFNKLELDKEKDNNIYVDDSIVNDKYLMLKGFKNINSVNNYFK